VKSLHFEGDAFTDILDDEIVNALSTLPDDFCTIVFLSDIEGYSYEEIADFLDCPIGTVRSRLHRARKMLYALLYTYAQSKGLVEIPHIRNKVKLRKGYKKLTFSNV